MNFKHGHASGQGNLSRTYRSWRSMKTRCCNPEDIGYPLYGGKGVAISPQWHTFANFLRDMGERPQGMTLDRYPNPDGNYEPGNCRWATLKEQANNKRNSRTITINGVSHTLAQWAEIAGISMKLLHSRIEYCKWSPERAVTTPVDKRRSEGCLASWARRKRIVAEREAHERKE